MPAIGICLTDHTEWMRSQLVDQGFDILSAVPESGQCHCVLITVVQEGLPLQADIMDHWLEQFDHVVLFNPETPPQMLQLAALIDRDRVTLVTTGHVAHDFQHAHVIEYENFFHEQQRLYQLPACAQDLQALRHSTDAPYRFDALLGQAKPHRNWLYQQINQTAPEQFLCRYYRLIHNLVQGRDFDWPRHAHSLSQVGKNASYHGTRIDVALVVPVDIYNDSLYSIVAETRTDAGYVFVTEKTAKCLIARRLFVMFAGPGYLAHLHRLGFRTFGSVIDESYDLEPNDIARWQQAWQQVQRLLELDPREVLPEIQPILEHNQQLLAQGDWGYHQRLRNHLRQLCLSRG